MKSPGYKVKVCIIGCGAIGAGMARTIRKTLNRDCKITGLYDADPQKAQKLASKLKLRGVLHKSLEHLILKCDIVVEATNAPNIKTILKQALEAQKSVLVMSVGKVLNEQSLFHIAKKNRRYILLPSGAIAGVDAIKAANLASIKKITLTTRKPPEGFGDNPYFKNHGINLKTLKKELVVFDGTVDQAIKFFPQNINVAATIALACGSKKKLRVKILTSPKFKRNSHEIEMEGDFGTMYTRTDNVVCPDNPKSSYLAVLSGLQTLKQYCTGILVGT